MSRPLLALTMGDVAGIGPEIIAKAFRNSETRELARIVVIGDIRALERGIADTGVGLDVHSIHRIGDIRDEPGVVDILQPGEPINAPTGEISAAAGAGSVAFIKEACRLGRNGDIDGIVTAPLNKAAMHAAGHLYPGHTELLAEEFGVSRFALVLAAESLYVFHITTHVALRDAIDLMTKQRALATIRLAGAFASAVGDGSAPIGVMGLNPHAGEGGLFGTEEASVLAPAISDARKEGLQVEGPLPGDALFPQAVQGKWRYIVVCYHDQGHIPFKSYYGDEGVNITAGLPVVRVSVDHGTAFDIVGQGIAREESLLLAIRRAAAFVPDWSMIWDTVQER
ncbi:MAG: 4-hydroxythreonine-4-phosphate dehydrogenase PdxA [Dehalococcoidia bacterium]